MSHNITLYCGCVVYVACHPHTGVAHTRVLEHRHPLCPIRKHEVGLRLALWELLPDAIDRVVDPFAGADQHHLASGAIRAEQGSGRKTC